MTATRGRGSWTGLCRRPGPVRNRRVEKTRDGNTESQLVQQHAPAAFRPPGQRRPRRDRGYEQQPRVLHGDRERRERCGEQKKRPAEGGGANHDPEAQASRNRQVASKVAKLPRKITASDTEKSAAGDGHVGVPGCRSRRGVPGWPSGVRHRRAVRPILGRMPAPERQVRWRRPAAPRPVAGEHGGLLRIAGLRPGHLPGCPWARPCSVPGRSALGSQGRAQRLKPAPGPRLPRLLGPGGLRLPNSSPTVPEHQRYCWFRNASTLSGQFPVDSATGM